MLDMSKLDEWLTCPECRSQDTKLDTSKNYAYDGEYERPVSSNLHIRCLDCGAEVDIHA